MLVYVLALCLYGGYRILKKNIYRFFFESLYELYVLDKALACHPSVKM